MCVLYLIVYGEINGPADNLLCKYREGKIYRDLHSGETSTLPLERQNRVAQQCLGTGVWSRSDRPRRAARMVC